jgi:phosphate transport system protein
VVQFGQDGPLLWWIMTYNRSGWRRHLREIDMEVGGLFAWMADGVPRATGAFLHGNTIEVAVLAARNRGAEEILAEVESVITIDLARWAPMGSDLRFLVTVLRVVPESERSADLVEHISKRALVGSQLPAELKQAFAEMCEVAADMWGQAGSAWAEVDPTAAGRLDKQNDHLDVATEGLSAALVGLNLPPLVAMEAVLAGRFYEHLGDHAVHLCERIRWLATGRYD